MAATQDLVYPAPLVWRDGITVPAGPVVAAVGCDGQLAVKVKTGADVIGEFYGRVGESWDELTGYPTAEALAVAAGAFFATPRIGAMAGLAGLPVVTPGGRPVPLVPAGRWVSADRLLAAAGFDTPAAYVASKWRPENVPGCCRTRYRGWRPGRGSGGGQYSAYRPAPSVVGGVYDTREAAEAAWGAAFPVIGGLLPPDNPRRLVTELLSAYCGLAHRRWESELAARPAAG